MAILCQTLMNIIEEMAPLGLAEDWDNVGLVLGDPQAKIEGVLIALDLNLGVVEEAQKEGTNFILVHHPPIFQGLKKINASEPQGKMLLKAMGYGLNVYAAHTNLDKVFGGVSDELARNIGLSEIEILVPGEEQKLYKLVVFVPKSHEGELRQAIGDAGAGFIGNYSHCTFRASGTGTFLPKAGAEPYLGKIGVEEEVLEFRLETIVPEDCLAAVLKAMFVAHPYEEVAYDLYFLANKSKPVAGLGRIGNLPGPLTLEALVGLVKNKLEIPNVKVVGGSAKSISRVAVCGGSGGSVIREAVSGGAQVLITGDVDYHQGQDAESLGLAIIDAGHGPTEKVILPRLASYLSANFISHKLMSPVLISKVNTDPWRYY